MTYIIRNSQGTVLVTLPDNRVDQSATSLSLIGRNVNAYGEFYNQNLVNLLDNFSTVGVVPRSPVVGQLWHNRQDDRLYICSTDNVFRPVGVSQVSPSEPIAPNPGDLWIDNINKQLYFSSDGLDFTLVGPPLASTSTAVRNGWFETNLITTASTTATVVVLYNNNKVVAVASSSTFAFSPPLDGLTSVDAGIKLNDTIPNIRFVGTAINSDFVNTFTNNYLRFNPSAAQTVSKSLIIADDSGLVVGELGDVSLYTDANYAYISGNVTDKKLKISVRSSITGNYMDVLTIDPNESSRLTAKFFSTSSSTLSVTGDLEVGGSARYARTFALSMNITGFTNTNTEIISYLNFLLPVSNAPPADKFDIVNGSRVRVLCEVTEVSTVTSAVSVTRTVKEFAVSSSAWQFASIVA
jgi:hypothetical protein